MLTKFPLYIVRNLYGKITRESIELVLIYDVYGFFLDMRHWWNEYDLPQMVKSIYFKKFSNAMDIGYTIYHSNYFPILSYFATVLCAEIIFGNYNFIFSFLYSLSIVRPHEVCEIKDA